jgi:hypothetical protein
MAGGGRIRRSCKDGGAVMREWGASASEECLPGLAILLDANLPAAPSGESDFASASDRSPVRSLLAVDRDGFNAVAHPRCRASRCRHGTRTGGPPCMCGSVLLSSSYSSWVQPASRSFSDRAPRDPLRRHPSPLWNVPPRRLASRPSKLSFHPIIPQSHQRVRTLPSHPTNRPRRLLGARRAAGKSPRTAAPCGSPPTECLDPSAPLVEPSLR